LNIDFGMNNENRYNVFRVLVGGKRVKVGDKGEGVWLMGFIYI
jgi:hypothetical protein